jgi:hypothetical protein
MDRVSLDGALLIRRLDVLIRPADAIDALRDVAAPQRATTRRGADARP